MVEPLVPLYLTANGKNDGNTFDVDKIFELVLFDKSGAGHGHHQLFRQHDALAGLGDGAGMLNINHEAVIAQAHGLIAR